MPNALAGEQSPYLLQHADNPVEWRPWSEEAFELAREQDKLVFLSVGYSTCHWCHVMAHESFENAKVAEVLNHHFINVKLDREERPDIDALYMSYLQLTTGQGGWPMSLWLDPGGDPVFGGTYFPPEDKHGRAGFTRVCHELARVWRDDRAKLLEHAARVMGHLRKPPEPVPSASFKVEIALKDYLEHCRQRFDVELGGFGGAPKFPRPVVLDALMAIARHESPTEPQQTKAWSMCHATLKAMAAGGMNDHLGGGFHRYSVDAYWHVPHYEKMLYDQGQLACSYLEGWELSGDPQLRQVAEDILHYLVGTMRDEAGAFHAAEDADSLEHADSDHAIEGAYWTWRADEIQQLLEPKAAAIFCEAYGVEAEGNARPESDPHGELEGRNTLYRAKTDEQLAAVFDLSPSEISSSLTASKAKLLEARLKRPPPHRDDKIITAWNGLAIAAFALAGRLLAEPKWTHQAIEAAHFLRRELWQDGQLYRSWRKKRSSAVAVADDYVCLIHGLLELHRSDEKGGWLEWALDLQAELDAKLWDDAWQGYVMRPQLAGKTLMTVRSDYDGAEPSANHLAILNLQKLAALSGDDNHRQRADRLIQAGRPSLQHSFAVPVLITALAKQDGLTSGKSPAAG